MMLKYRKASREWRVNNTALIGKRQKAMKNCDTSILNCGISILIAFSVRMHFYNSDYTN